MSTFKAQIREGIIVLRKASDKACLELALKTKRKLFNRFINTLTKLKALEGDIIIKGIEILDIEEIEDKTKKAITEFRMKKESN